MSAGSQHWNKLRATLHLSSAGAGLPGKFPVVALQRLSDGKYFSGTAWVSAFTELAMAEVSSVNLPGYYAYVPLSSALDHDSGLDGYLFRIRETTTATLLLEHVVPIRRAAWDDVRTGHSTLGTFGKDLAHASLTAPGAVGDAVITLKDKANAVVEGARVRIYDSSGVTLVVQGTTGADGKVTFGLSAGSYKVKVSKAGTDFGSANPTTLTVVSNSDVPPQLDGILPTTAAIGAVIAVFGRHFGTSSVRVVFGTTSVAASSVNPEGTLALVTIPTGLTGTVVAVTVTKPDPATPPSGVLTSNGINLTLA